MLETKRRYFFTTEPIAELENQPFATFENQVSTELAQNNFAAAFKTANHAAMEYGASGLYLLHRVNQAQRNIDIEAGEFTEKSDFNMLVKLILAKKLCETFPDEKSLFLHCFPNATEGTLEQSIQAHCDDAEIHNLMSDAVSAAENMVSSFAPTHGLPAQIKRELLLDAILPARKVVISANEQEFHLLNIKAAKQRLPALTIEKMFIRTDNGFIESSSMSVNPAPTRIIIHCRGNMELYQQLQSELIDSAQQTGALMVGFNLPSVAGSAKVELTTQVLVDAIKNVVLYYQNKTGINFNNIILQGHSLGAALATIAAEQLHQSNQTVRLVNGRSFANAITVAENNTGFLAGFADSLRENVDLMIDAGSAYLKIPSTHKMLICAQNDLVIPQASSMLEYVCTQSPEQADQLRLDNTYQEKAALDAHNCSLTNLYNTHKQMTAAQAIMQFVTQTVTTATQTPAKTQYSPR